MSGLLSALVGLLRLRAGPQDLPVSWPLTIALFSAYVGVGLVTGQQLGIEDNAGRTLVSAVIQLLVLQALLRFRGVPERLPQSLLALAMTGIVVSLVAFTLLIQADGSGNQPGMALAWFGVFAWSLLVEANIYRHAMVVGLPQGVLVAVALLAVTYVVLHFTFPAPA